MNEFGLWEIGQEHDYVLVDTCALELRNGFDRDTLQFRPEIYKESDFLKYLDIMQKLFEYNFMVTPGVSSEIRRLNGQSFISPLYRGKVQNFRQMVSKRFVDLDEEDSTRLKELKDYFSSLLGNEESLVKRNIRGFSNVDLEIMLYSLLLGSRYGSVAVLTNDYGIVSSFEEAVKSLQRSWPVALGNIPNRIDYYSINKGNRSEYTCDASFFPNLL